MICKECGHAMLWVNIYGSYICENCNKIIRVPHCMNLHIATDEEKELQIQERRENRDKGLKLAVKCEKEASCMQHQPKFYDWHHAHSIILEEVEEVIEEAENIEESFSLMWDRIKDNDYETAKDILDTMSRYASKLLIEVTQLNAICEKAKEME